MVNHVLLGLADDTFGKVAVYVLCDKLGGSALHVHEVAEREVEAALEVDIVAEALGHEHVVRIILEVQQLQTKLMVF